MFEGLRAESSTIPGFATRYRNIQNQAPIPRRFLGCEAQKLKSSAKVFDTGRQIVEPFLLLISAKR